MYYYAATVNVVTSSTLAHCKMRIFNVTCSLSFCLQMSEPITHIDTDHYHDGMRMHKL